jgi:hypothetical protein
MAATPDFAELEKMSAAAQNDFFVTYFAAYGGTVTAAWIKQDPSLAPYAGQSALQMYRALAVAYPSATPLQRGSTVFQTFLGQGAGSAISQVITAEGTAVGDTAVGVETASYVPSWATGLTSLLGDLTNKNTWLRLAEGLLGLLLIAVGLAHMTRAVPIATAIAGKVP